MDILKHLKTAVKLKLGRKCVFQMDNNSKHTSKVAEKWPINGQQSQSIGVAITKPRPKSYRQFVGRTEKRVRARRPTNLTQLLQLCQEEWAKIHPTYCGKLVEGYPKCLKVKQFKGNATKYQLSVCKLLTHWECDERNKSWNK